MDRMSVTLCYVVPSFIYFFQSILCHPGAPKNLNGSSFGFNLSGAYLTDCFSYASRE